MAHTGTRIWEKTRVPWMTNEGGNMAEHAVVAPMVAPVHLKSLTDIAATFKRRKETVKSWRDEGAPIALDSGQYCAEYNVLMAWLVSRSTGGNGRKEKSCQAGLKVPDKPLAFPPVTA